MKAKVFIDGESGTVGLNIRERLNGLNEKDFEILQIAPELSEDADERAKFLNTADFVFLCLPDEIARQAVSLIDGAGNTTTRVIDASTAHRTNPNWTYGFPELSAEHEKRIRNSNRVATPGCYASGFIALIYPLIASKMLEPSESLSCFGISGYSGAGKAFIAEYESENRSSELNSARMYALAQIHKHQPEMQTVCGLDYPPMFNPVIDNYYNGLVLSVPLQPRVLKNKITVDGIKKLYKSHYKNGRVKLADSAGITFLAANTLADSDDMELYVFGDENSERILLSARFDNLGKGASGAAVQCFDLMRKGVS
ncbi:MAG: N-acetyl-gamma-glutamyl-phosphate reductase [Oscillospiraceae bacterium]|nr:N-acetyl-gamma-glutamyl-phosphate reductase [Oscillospiraceae bacterium]